MDLPKPLFPDQEFFNIGEACRIVQVPDYTLRYWESRLKQIRPVRRESGHRRYTKRDLEIILRVKDLVNNQHMSLSGARRVILQELRRGGAPSKMKIESAATQQAYVTGEGPMLKVLRDLRSDLRDLLTELDR